MRAAINWNNRNSREAYKQFIAERVELDTFVTLVTNKTYDTPKMQKALKDFLARLDRELLGSQWAKKPMNVRTDGIIFIEHVASNTHAHGILRLPAQHADDMRDVNALIAEVWGKLAPAGNVDIQVIDDRVGCGDYCTKEMKYGHFREDQIVFPSDFANRQN